MTQIVLLTIQLHTLKQSNAHIRSQDAKLTRLYPLQRATARNSLPVLRDARGVIKPLGRQAGKVAQATNVLPDLASRTLDMANEVIPTMRGTRQLLSLVFGRNLIGTIERTAADVHASRALQEQSLAVQRQTLAIQKQALAILRQSQGIQAETLQHARNLDNKTGGSVATP